MKSFLSLAALLPSIAFVIAFGVAGFPARAESRVFTSAEGKKITGSLVSVSEDKVTLSRSRDLKSFTFSLSKLSKGDQEYIAKWKKKRDAAKRLSAEEILKEKRASERRAKIVSFCAEKKGSQVGNGQCWTLVNEAFKFSGAKRVDGQLRVWGRLLDLEKEEAQPGDVVEFRRAKISGFGTTAAEHTAVVLETGRRKSVTIAHQNWAGSKKVQETKLDLARIVSGVLMVYRPD